MAIAGCDREGGVHGESWYVSTYARACNKIASMKVSSRYPANEMTSRSEFGRPHEDFWLLHG